MTEPNHNLLSAMRLLETRVLAPDPEGDNMAASIISRRLAQDAIMREARHQFTFGNVTLAAHLVSAAREFGALVPELEADAERIERRVASLGWDIAPAA